MLRDEREALIKTNTEKYINERMPLKRSILASSLREAFAEPLVCMIHLPKNLRAYVEAELTESITRFVDITKGDVPSHAFVPNWASPEQAVVIRSDSEAVLSYWIRGPDRETSQATEDGPTAVEKIHAAIAPHWQLVYRKTDEVFEILHAFRRATQHLNMVAHLRNPSTRRQVSRRLVRPTERSERDAFQQWVYTRTPNAGTWYGETKERAMLQVPRWWVLNRFELTPADVRARLGESFEYYDILYMLNGQDGDVGWFDEDDEDNEGQARASRGPPKTAEEWLARAFSSPTDSWKSWHRQRIPPVELLPALTQGTARVGRRPRLTDQVPGLE
ncbi:hypothetical protein CF327_g7628 [Tilletia walkeri]|nr:hypothetical protein CF327_g7628 [Tilletia walkeri]